MKYNGKLLTLHLAYTLSVIACGQGELSLNGWKKNLHTKLVDKVPRNMKDVTENHTEHILVMGFL